MPKRHPFTESEDGHLVQFIALNNPDASGRNGNKLYKTLVENPKRWPWSKSHPWQSWRERYKKNAVWFDRKIKSYLRRKAPRKAATADPSDGSQLTVEPPQPVSASGQEEEDVSQTEEPAAEEEEQGTPQVCSGEDDYMHELFGSFTEEDVEPEDPPAPSSPSPPSPPISNSPSEERQLKPKVPDEDPFIDGTPPPPSPVPERHPATRKPPVLKEGPFRNIYVKPPNFGENKGAVWPPIRKRNETESPSQITESHVLATKPIIGRKIHQQVNAVASSSKVQLSPSTALQPDDPFLVGIAPQNSVQQPVPMPGSVLPETKIIAVGPDKGTKTCQCGRANVTEEPPTKRQKVGHPEPSVAHREATHSILAPIPNNSRGNSRTDNERFAARRIDLRESLKKRRVRSGSGRNSLLSSRGSTASISNSISNHTNRRNSAVSSVPRHRRQLVSSDQDLEFISLFERDLARIGEQYGFALGVVKKLYMEFGTLEKTVLALQALNTMMRGAQDKLYEEMQRLGSNDDGGTDDEDLIPEGVIPKNVSTSHDTPPSSRRRRQSLNYRPLNADVEDQSEYSPPSKTRAGRYTKLQKEGREEEAVIAASGGRFAMHLRNESRGAFLRGVHHQATTIKRGMEPSSPLDVDHEPSPTPAEEGVVGLRETGGGHEEEDGDGDDELTMDISPDQHDIRAPTPEVEQVDDEELQLKVEHKKLCSEVTLEHRDVLSAFEKRHGGDSWRRESGDLFQERFSTLKDVQEIRRQEYNRIEAKKADEGKEHDI